MYQAGKLDALPAGAFTPFVDQLPLLFRPVSSSSERFQQRTQKLAAIRRPVWCSPQRTQGTPTLAVQEFIHNGNSYEEYLLCKRDSLILVAQNCPNSLPLSLIAGRSWKKRQPASSSKFPRRYRPPFALPPLRPSRSNSSRRLSSSSRSTSSGSARLSPPDAPQACTVAHGYVFRLLALCWVSPGWNGEARGDSPRRGRALLPE